MFSKTLTIFLIFITLIYIPSAIANNYVLKDAENFAELFADHSPLTSKDIQEKYLDIGSQGIEIFMPARIINANNLTSVVNRNKSAYEKAIQLCLPAVQKLAVPVNKLLNKIKTLLGQDNAAPAYILFGANTSGGTATKDGLAIALEVLCWFAETPAEVSDVLLGFIAHEIFHVYQERSNPTLYSRDMTKQTPTLLKRSLVEGIADFVAFLALGEVNNAEIERHEYGLKNEAEIWSKFKKTMQSTKLGDWLYSQGKNKPNDMGYWIGKQIAASYYKNADNKTKALKELLLLEDPTLILLNSGYNPE